MRVLFSDRDLASCRAYADTFPNEADTWEIRVIEDYDYRYRELFIRWLYDIQYANSFRTTTATVKRLRGKVVETVVSDPLLPIWISPIIPVFANPKEDDNSEFTLKFLVNPLPLSGVIQMSK